MKKEGDSAKGKKKEDSNQKEDGGEQDGEESSDSSDKKKKVKKERSGVPDDSLIRKRLREKVAILSCYALHAHLQMFQTGADKDRQKESEQAKRKQHQEELARKKREEAERRFAESKDSGAKGKGAASALPTDFIAYNSVNDYPKV